MSDPTNESYVRALLLPLRRKCSYGNNREINGSDPKKQNVYLFRSHVFKTFPKRRHNKRRDTLHSCRLTGNPTIWHGRIKNHDLAAEAWTNSSFATLRNGHSSNFMFDATQNHVYATTVLRPGPDRADETHLPATDVQRIIANNVTKTGALTQKGWPHNYAHFEDGKIVFPKSCEDQHIRITTCEPMPFNTSSRRYSYRALYPSDHTRLYITRSKTSPESAERPNNFETASCMLRQSKRRSRSNKQRTVVKALSVASNRQMRNHHHCVILNCRRWCTRNHHRNPVYPIRRRGKIHKEVKKYCKQRKRAVSSWRRTMLMILICIWQHKCSHQVYGSAKFIPQHCATLVASRYLQKRNTRRGSIERLQQRTIQYESKTKQFYFIYAARLVW